MQPITYAQLKATLDTLTPQQLEQPVVWSGDERGGTVHKVWIADEDWIGDMGDHESWLPRSEAMAVDPESYRDAEIGIPMGTVQLLVD